MNTHPNPYNRINGLIEELRSMKGKDIVIQGPVPIRAFLAMIRYAKSVKIRPATPLKEKP